MVTFYQHAVDPEFDKAARLVDIRGYKVKMIAVKTELNSAFAKKHKIEHLPSK
jgi:hypothetical protein